MKRLSKNTFITPSEGLASEQSPNVCTQIFCPFRLAFSYIIQRPRPITSRVAILFFTSCPFYIPWLIVTIIVDAIYGMLGGWSFPHFCEKLFKGMKPKLNTSPAIIRMGFICNAIATVFCVVIGSVFSRKRRSMGRAHFDCQAAARLSTSTSQTTSINKFDIATLTLAIPKSAVFSNAAVSDDGQSPERTSFNV